MAVKRKTKKSASTDNKITFIIKKICIASVIGVIVFFIICAISAFIIYKKDAEPTCYPIVLLIISGISGLVCGLAAILPVRKNGLVTGMASVIPAFFIIFVIVSIMNRTAISSVGWSSLGIMTICGAIGGIVGNKK